MTQTEVSVRLTGVTSPFGRLYDWTVANASEIQARQCDYDQSTQL